MAKPRISMVFGAEGLSGMLAKLTMRSPASPGFPAPSSPSSAPDMTHRACGWPRPRAAAHAAGPRPDRTCWRRPAACRNCSAATPRAISQRHNHARALHDAPDFLVDQPLRVLELRPHIGDLRMPRTIFAGQVGFVLGDIGILRAQLGFTISEETAALSPPASPPVFANCCT